MKNVKSFKRLKRVKLDMKRAFDILPDLKSIFDLYLGGKDFIDNLNFRLSFITQQNCTSFQSLICKLMN